jgi:CHRD domain/PEP-CTERM motif
MRYQVLLTVLLAVFVPLSASGSIVFTAALSGANENPPNGSPGTGTVTLVLDPVAQTLQLNVTFSGLTSNDVAAHIHCCLGSPLAPGNIGVATAVPALPGFPLGVTSGTYTSPVFDLTQPTIYNPAFVTAEGGLSQAEAALIAGIENEETYFNIHTVNFGGGEIRGFLVPAIAPEPSTLLLLVSGLAGCLLTRRRLG